MENLKNDKYEKNKNQANHNKDKKDRKDKNEKMNTSLVIRINLKMSLRMLGMFFALDLVIFALFMFSLEYAKGEFSLTLDPANAWNLFEQFMWIIGIAEVLIVLFNLGQNARTIHKELKPLNDLAQTARVLNNAREMTPEELNRLMGTLQSINANHLDTRISTSSLNSELQPLAFAINEMLARIDQSYQSQMRFVSDASHELRTPIAVIQGYANLLDRWGKDDPKTLQESIDAIRSESNAMKDLVEQLLFLARGDNETMKLDITEFNISRLAEDVMKELRMIDSTHVFSAEIQKDVIVKADEGLIKQLMRILMDNGMKYTSSGGLIKIQLKEEGISETDSMISIQVQDEGVGIPAEALPYIFERFYRADQSRARETGGTGLGLSIAKWIVEKHGGKLEVISREGIGTRFTIFIEKNC